LLDVPTEPADHPQAQPLTEINGQVSISQVYFAYDKAKPLLQAINIKADHGQRIAIVGPTGCGKTTLINLLMRFYDVDRGVISIDGHDILSLPRQNVRSAFGMVLQDTWLANATVADNIAFGCPQANRQQIEQAAKQCHADEFIQRLPQGYDTILNSADSGLSAGQQQLLCIARVILAKPKMLILDEATSAIDTRTELLVGQAFDALMKGRTSFVVAHRLSTIRNADLIIVMQNGRIVQSGKHDQLLKDGGAYAQLYNSQFEQVG
jgi:ATP-binding cassette subfamily B multidrug efflux pump